MEIIHTQWVEDELVELRNLGAAGAADAGAIRNALVKWKEYGAIPCPGFAAFKPIEGPPYYKKMWEAVKQGSQRDKIHGYRLFYQEFYNVKKETMTAVVVKCWGKAGKHSPKKVLMDAWNRCLIVEAEIQAERFF
jgi:hypothetical protein